MTHNLRLFNELPIDSLFVIGDGLRILRKVSEHTAADLRGRTQPVNPGVLVFTPEYTRGHHAAGSPNGLTLRRGHVSVYASGRYIGRINCRLTRLTESMALHDAIELERTLL